MVGNILAGRRWAKLALLGALLPVAAVSLAATAPSSRTAGRHTLLACGDTVTTDITLSSDLNCSASDALDVGANGITIDLNGHTTTGDGSHNGIFNNGHTGFVIKNGTVRHFRVGVFLENGANSNTVKNVRAIGNADNAIIVQDSNNVQLTGNSAFSTGGIAIFVGGGSGDQVTGNVAEANSQEGILMSLSTSGFVVSGNTSLNNGGYGIEVFAPSSGQLSSNVANGNTLDGIFVKPDDTSVTLTKNLASFNDQLGINAAPGDGDGGKNVVQDNASAKQCANIVCTEVVVVK
jgi:parallel beta-helix repeat protein